MKAVLLPSAVLLSFAATSSCLGGVGAFAPAVFNPFNDFAKVIGSVGDGSKSSMSSTMMSNTGYNSNGMVRNGMSGQRSGGYGRDSMYSGGYGRDSYGDGGFGGEYDLGNRYAGGYAGGYAAGGDTTYGGRSGYGRDNYGGGYGRNSYGRNGGYGRNSYGGGYNNDQRSGGWYKNYGGYDGGYRSDRSGSLDRYGQGPNQYRSLYGNYGGNSLPSTSSYERNGSRRGHRGNRREMDRYNGGGSRDYDRYNDYDEYSGGRDYDRYGRRGGNRSSAFGRSPYEDSYENNIGYSYGRGRGGAGGYGEYRDNMYPNYNREGYDGRGRESSRRGGYATRGNRREVW